MSNYRKNFEIELSDVEDKMNIKLYEVNDIEINNRYYRCPICDSHPGGYFEGTVCKEGNRFYWKPGFFKKKYCTLNKLHFHYHCGKCKSDWVYFVKIDDKVKEILV